MGAAAPSQGDGGFQPLSHRDPGKLSCWDPGNPRARIFTLLVHYCTSLACDGHAEGFGEGTTTRVQYRASVDVMPSGPHTGLCPEP